MCVCMVMLDIIYGLFWDVFNDENLWSFVKCMDVSKILFWLLGIVLTIGVTWYPHLSWKRNALIITTALPGIKVLWKVPLLGWLLVFLNYELQGCFFWLSLAWDVCVLVHMSPNPSPLVLRSQSLLICINREEKYRGESSHFGYKSSLPASTVVPGRQAIWQERLKAERVQRAHQRSRKLMLEIDSFRKDFRVVQSGSSFHFNPSYAQNSVSGWPYFLCH